MTTGRNHVPTTSCADVGRGGTLHAMSAPPPHVLLPGGRGTHTRDMLPALCPSPACLLHIHAACCQLC
jgi:hypothetical protein